MCGHAAANTFPHALSRSARSRVPEDRERFRMEPITNDAFVAWIGTHFSTDTFAVHNEGTVREWVIYKVE
jgi:hypothetical protein